jgi:hypothetical protein
LQHKNGEIKMSRNFRSSLGVGLVVMAIMLLIVFGVGVALNYMLLGGIMDLYVGMTTLGDMTLIITGITKVICSGPAALLAILAIQVCLRFIDRLHGWKAELG